MRTMVFQYGFNRRTGVALLECVLALSLLGVGAAVVGGAFWQARTWTVRARRQTQALMLAENTLVEWELGAIEPTRANGPCPPPFERFLRQLSAEPSRWEGLDELRVVVRHEMETGRTELVRLALRKGDGVELSGENRP